MHFPALGTEPNPELLDRPAPLAPLQWWYGNAHLRFKKNPKRSLGFFASFFRQCKDFKPKQDSTFFDACRWALIDNDEQKYYPDSLLDHRSLTEIRKRIDPALTGRPMGGLEGILFELVENGRLTRPDRLMKTEAIYKTEPFFCINLSDESVLEVNQRNGKRIYHFIHFNSLRGVSVDLLFESEDTPVLLRENGMVNGMYYYYYPMMHVSGRVTMQGRTEDVVGEGWYDREFGGALSPVGRDAMDTWRWLSLQFSNGSQLCVFHIMDNERNETKELVAVYTFKGVRRVCTDITLNTMGEWTSLLTFTTYSSAFLINIFSIGLSCSLSPTFNAQEFPSVLIPGGGFYEGCVVGDGTIEGENVTLQGFFEHKSTTEYLQTQDLLKKVGKYVHETLVRLYPLSSSEKWIQDNVLGRHAAIKGTPANKICETLFHPVRSLIDRGGKSWRSLIFISCCNAISPNYFDCSRYIAMAELLHVGSLIIDDIQDNSLIRRGGNCIHLEYGVPTAINAGTACYFMAPHFIEIHSLPMEKANKIYQLYFDIMREGHIGQGLDIYGLNYLMPQAVESGNVEPLVDALKAIHILKTGGVAGSICLMACILCDATPEVSAALEQYGINVGLAFQIVDDALNVKGFEHNLKELHEDLRNGKVTFPIIKALERLPFADRQRLWDILQTKPTDPAQVETAVRLLESVEAAELCLQDARLLIEESWLAVDPFLEDSISKNIMFAFSKYLTERTK